MVLAKYVFCCFRATCDSSWSSNYICCRLCPTFDCACISFPDEPQGLIRGRIAGADSALSDNLFFLDAHCKPQVGWEYPLLQHLKTNYRRVACPVIYVSLPAADWQPLKERALLQLRETAVYMFYLQRAEGEACCCDSGHQRAQLGGRGHTWLEDDV